MSINFNRSRFNEAKTSRNYKRMQKLVSHPIYWDEGIKFYPIQRRGFKCSEPKYSKKQIRAYKNWKHNRRTQYKAIMTIQKL